MKKFVIASAALAIGALVQSAPAFAGQYTLNCVDSNSGQSVSVTVEAASRADAIDKVRNDPAYSSYDQCK